MADTILTEPLVILRHIPYEELLDLQKMVHDKDHAMPYRYGLTWNCITQIGLTDHVKSEGTDFQFIYPDLAEALKPVADKYIENLDPDAGKVRFEKIILGLLNIYGILSPDDLFALCSSFEPQLTSEKIFNTIDDSFLLQNRCIREEKNNLQFVSPFLEKNDSLLEEINSRHFVKQATFTLEEVLAASHAENPVPPENEATREVHRLLTETLGNEEDALWRISQLWMLINNDRDPYSLIQTSLNHQEMTIDQLKGNISIIMDWMNRLPRWIMKGNSSHAVYHKYERPHLTQTPPEIVLGPNARKAGISVSQEEFNEQWRGNVKKPGRNDPCPCGSGKKYKHCCGR